MTGRTEFQGFGLKLLLCVSDTKVGTVSPCKLLSNPFFALKGDNMNKAIYVVAYVFLVIVLAIT